jgi:type I restriction enzyme R subunit
MVAARKRIEGGVFLLILEAGWHDSDILAEEMAYANGRVLNLDLVLLYQLYPLAVVELGTIGKPLEITEGVARYAAVNEIPYVLAADGEHVVGMATESAEALGYPEFPAPTELWTALGREPAEKDPRIYPPAERPEMEVTLPMALAVARALDAIMDGERRVLLAMAEETGRGPAALQIAWKLLGSGRCRRALYLVSRPEMLDYAEWLFQPFGERAAILGGDRPVTGAEEVQVAPMELLDKSKDLTPSTGAMPEQYDLVLIPDTEARADWESVSSCLGKSVVVGFSDKEPPSEGVTGFFGPPRFTYPLEAELAMRAAAAEPAEDVFDELTRE